jgi:hypothetical protein
MVRLIIDGYRCQNEHTTGHVIKAVLDLFHPSVCKYIQAHPRHLKIAIR